MCMGLIKVVSFFFGSLGEYFICTDNVSVAHCVGFLGDQVVFVSH